MEDLSTQIKVLLNKLSAYESLQKQDAEHRKLIRELQKENRELKQQVKNNGVLDDVIKRAFYAGRERESHPDWDFIFEDYEDYLKWKDHPSYKKYGL